MRITIEVTEAQHAEIKLQAGMIPLSRWIKAQIFPVDDAQRAKELIPLLRKSIEKSEKVAKGGSVASRAEVLGQIQDREENRSSVDMKRFLP